MQNRETPWRIESFRGRLGIALRHGYSWLWQKEIRRHKRSNLINVSRLTVPYGHALTALAWLWKGLGSQICRSKKFCFALFGLDLHQFVDLAR